MSTVWTYDDDVDEWESLPEHFTLWSVGPRGGRRFIDYANEDLGTMKQLLERAAGQLESNIKYLDWVGVGVVLLDANGAEVGYLSLRA